MKILILISIFFLNITYVFGQKGGGTEQPFPQEPCYFDQLIRDNPDIRERMNLLDENILNYQNSQSNRSTQNLQQITIPVVVYVVHKSTDVLGSGSNISDDQVISQIDAMNNYFQSYNINFCLATMAGNGPIIPLGGVQNTPGIIHKSNSNLSDHDVQTEQQSLVGLLHTDISPQKYLRIWVVNSINGLGNNVLGYSMFPNSSYIFDGIVVRYDAFGDNTGCSSNCYNLYQNYDKGKTLIHEFGHYMGLYHTFEGGCNSQALPCNEHGDKVCDTPTVASANFTCFSGMDSCLQDIGQDDVTNFMDYGNDNCANHFSLGQIERIEASLLIYRSELYSTSNLIYTGICDYESLVSADFEAETYSPCVGQQIEFNAIQQNGNSYLWDFGDGTISNLPNPTHIFQTPSSTNSYTVSLTINGISTSSINFFVTDCNQIQNTESNWYFSKANMFNFSNGSPVKTTIPVSNICGEATSIQNDSNGNLLFYTNGIKIWNNNHNIINNTNLLLGDESSLKGVSIVPNPANSNQYYIFTKAKQGELNGFRYSIVNLNGSNITINTINQPISVLGYNSGNNGALISNESIGVSQHCNGYWIFTTAFKDSNEYLLVFNLTLNGLTLSNQFLIGSLLPGSNFVNYQNSIEVSPNGNFICLSRNRNVKKNLFTFNKHNGIITNNIELFNLDHSSYDSQFSPDSSVIYFTDGYGKIYYYNINSSASKFIILNNLQSIGGMQLGPDNKIYISKVNRNTLSAINTPNDLSLNENIESCNYTEFAGPFLDTSLNRGLPNIIDAKISSSFNNTISSYPQNCLTYQFFPNACGSSFNWDFGDPASGSSNIFTGTVATHTFSSEGSYTVTLRDNNNVIINALTVNVGITPPTVVGSTSACLDTIDTTNNSIVLENGYNVVWSITGGNGTMGLNNQSDVTIQWTSLPGTITATVTNSLGCSYQVNKTILSNCSSASCPSDYTFTSTENATIPTTYNASATIETNGNYLVNSGSNITLTAGTSITFKPNSEIKSGAEYLAKIENCPPSSDRISKKESQEIGIFENEGKLLIYPNPSNEWISITSNAGDLKSVNIISLDGKFVYEEYLEKVKSLELNIGNYEKSVYLIIVETINGQIFKEKLIKN